MLCEHATDAEKGLSGNVDLIYARRLLGPRPSLQTACQEGGGGREERQQARPEPVQGGEPAPFRLLAGPGPHFAACSGQHRAHPAKAPHGGPVVDPTEHLATRMQMAPLCITLPC